MIKKNKKMGTLLQKSLLETSFLTRIKDPHQREIVLYRIKEIVKEYAAKKKYISIFDFFRKKSKKDDDVLIACTESEIQRVESVNNEAEYLCNINIES